MKTVSIIIPVYNVASYLPQCLDSLLGQTYSDLEIILIDDGSTDESGLICENYAATDKRIRLVHKENAGAANAKNTGLNLASGDYITFADSDDYVELNWIEKMVSALETKNADLAECNFLCEYKDHSEMGNENNFLDHVFTGKEYMAQYLDKWSNSLFWNKLFKAELTRDVRFRKERRCIDDEFYTYKVVGKAQKVVRINDALYHYRQRLSSAMKSQEHLYQRVDDALEVLPERFRWIKDTFHELRTYYLRRDINNLHFFAQGFTFSEELIKKYHATVWFYLRECFREKTDWTLIRKTLLLLSYNKKSMLADKKHEQSFIDGLFK